MGCDIHLIIERKHQGKWVTVRIPHWSEDCCRRDYERFAKLASVRGETEAVPLGIPNDISETANYIIHTRWGSDGHSHSYMTLKEAREKFEDYITDEHECLGVPIDEYRVLFFFDN